MESRPWRLLVLDPTTYKRLIKAGLTHEDLQVWRQNNPGIEWCEFSPRGYRTRFNQGHSRGFRPGQKGADHPATIDGRSHHYLYNTWVGMMRRCYYEDAARYDYYGARGIKVCERWHDPLKFYEDIENVLGVRPLHHTLDRIDNDGNYEPTNVRWSSYSAQRMNDRRSQRGVEGYNKP